MTKLPLVSAPVNEADDTNAPEPHEEHTRVEYIGNDVISTEEPKKITDIVFFGIVKGW